MRRALLISLILILLPALSFAEFPAVEVYQKTSKAVVLIFSHCKESGNSLGAGSIILSDGLVITSAHVVVDKKSSKPCSDIRIYLKPHKVTGKFQTDLVNRYHAKILAYSTDLDLAVLKINNPPENLGEIELANPEDIKIGEEVIAIGHPEQGGLWTLTYGRISGEIENQNNIQGKAVYQTDTSINRGNSGGPLLDRNGYMVAVNANVARIGYDNMPITGVNFAIKSSVVKKWLNQNGYMIAYGKKPLIEKEREVEKTDIKPEEKTTEEEKKIEDTGESKNVGTKEPEATPQEKFQTPKRPYDYDALLKAVEAELEDMMEEIRGKIRR